MVINVQGDGARRSAGRTIVARALWYVQPGQVELRPERLAPLGPDDVRVTTLYSAISRGTERLVCGGHIPERERGRMRAPFQSGEFPFPVKYGYAAVGRVAAGPQDFSGRIVFALHPHQDIFHLAAAHVFTLPADVSPERATLAANMETALNANWDAATSIGDRVLVIGAGIVGLLTAYLARRLTGREVTIIDPDTSKKAAADSLRLSFTHADDAELSGFDICFETSASAAGLNRAIRSAGFEATICVLGWFAGGAVAIDLGGAFHSQRLRLISSQVGHVSQSRRDRVSRRDRLAMAIGLLADPALDALVETRVEFDELPIALPAILGADARGLPPIVAYRVI